jgi:hypothetical protein
MPSIQTYNDLFAWTAAAGFPLKTEDFSSLSQMTGPNFSGPTGSISGFVYADAALPVTRVPPTHPYRVLNFTPSTTAFGGDWDLTPPSGFGGLILTAVFDDGTTQLIGNISNDPQISFKGFFGFISDTPFTSIRYQSDNVIGSGFTLDNVRFRGQVWFPYYVPWITLPFLRWYIGRKKTPA